MVISTGITLPRMDSVWALYALQNSMMLTPCGPRAVPTGGAGVAAPACSCTLTSAAIFFLGGISFSLSCGHDGGGAPCHSYWVSRRVTLSLAALGTASTLLNLFGFPGPRKLGPAPQTF